MYMHLYNSFMCRSTAFMCFGTHPTVCWQLCQHINRIFPCLLTVLTFPTGFLIGGDVLRLLYGHMDECLTVPSGQYGEEHRR